MRYGAPSQVSCLILIRWECPFGLEKNNVKLCFEPEPWGQLNQGYCKELLFNQRLSKMQLIKHQMVLMVGGFF